MTDDRKCYLCEKQVPEDQTKKVHCSRCFPLFSPGHHVHDKCWEEYVAEQEAIHDREPQV